LRGDPAGRSAVGWRVSVIGGGYGARVIDTQS
jgi:hypothetical protein